VKEPEEQSKPRIPEWKKQTPAQRLSNRTILRFKNVADQLCNALNSIVPGIKGVLFVSADRTEEFKKVRSSSPPRRYYNLRLLQTCQFTNEEEVKPLWNWLLKNADRFEVLFRLAANVESKENQFSSFKELIEEAKKSPADEKRLKEAVHDLLIDAIAVMPYTHLLPSVFDSVVFNDSWKSSNDKPYWFEFNGKEKKVAVWEFDGFVKQCPNNLSTLGIADSCQDLIAQGHFAAQGSAKDMEDRNALGELYLNVFINDFMLGSDLKNSNPAEEEWYSPYRKRKGSLKSVKGFFIPIYHFQDSKGKPAGGFEGWMIAIFDKDPEVSHQAQPGSNNEAFKLALRGFAQRLSWERMRELTEKEWGNAMSPREFTLQHYQHFGGWEGVLPDGQIDLPRVPDDWAFMFCSIGEGEPKEVRIYTDQEHKEKVCIDSKAETFDQINRIEYVAVLPPNQQSGSNKANNQPFLFKIRPDTILPAEHHDLVSYGFHIARSVKIIYESACLREAQRTSGFLASAHDYSKDIGSVLLRLSDFKRDLDRSRTAVQEKAKQVAALPAPAAELGSAILEETRCWSAPRFEWFSGVRFTNAHLETQTRGILVSEPAECVAMLEGGTLREIYEIVRILVWHPIPFQKLKDKEREFTKFAPEKLRLPSTWWALFTFDIDPLNRSRAFHERLGQRLLRLILDEKIDQPTFAKRFKIPRINPAISIDDPSTILWANSNSLRWRPLNGLLPLFVFSMRFAFQCTWARTLLEEPSEALGIQLEAAEPQSGKYELSIQFPSPLPEPRVKFEALPYYSEWHAQIRHYTGSQTAPWKAEAETNPPVERAKGELCRIKLLASV
jgi:hypothetical protein